MFVMNNHHVQKLRQDAIAILDVVCISNLLANICKHKKSFALLKLLITKYHSFAT